MNYTKWEAVWENSLIFDDRDGASSDCDYSQLENTYVRVITHDGVFHADDVVAVAIATLALQYVKVVRTRNTEVLEAGKTACAVLLDVRGEYDPARGLYDHHQKAGEMPSAKRGRCSFTT